jgi:hypothetical protein
LELIFSSDQLKSIFTSTQNGATSYRRVKNNAGSDELASSNTFDLEVFNALHQIKLDATGLDGVPLKFPKLILPQVLGIVTHIFNTILTTSIYPAGWKTSKIMLIAKKANQALCRIIDPSSYSHHSPKPLKLL